MLIGKETQTEPPEILKTLISDFYRLIGNYWIDKSTLIKTIDSMSTRKITEIASAASKLITDYLQGVDKVSAFDKYLIKYVQPILEGKDPLKTEQKSDTTATTTTAPSTENGRPRLTR